MDTGSSDLGKNIFMIDTALTLASNTWSVKLREGLL